MMKDEWITPPEIIDALGPFDLDPCAPVNYPWPTAKVHYNVINDGLTKPWEGRVWCNPPYGKETRLWLCRLVGHRNGIALVFARTETKMFFDYVWNEADALLFLRGRLNFHHVDGSRAKANSGAPSVLIAYGQQNVDSLRRSGLPGKLIILRQ